MIDDQPAGEGNELVYMVSGEDQAGDTHIFVTSNLNRAKDRHREMLSTFAAVKANWLEQN